MQAAEIVERDGVDALKLVLDRLLPATVRVDAHAEMRVATEEQLAEKLEAMSARASRRVERPIQEGSESS